MDTWTIYLTIIDDTTIYNVASNLQDTAALQSDLDSATLWSERWDMHFNPMKSIHLSINAKAITEYRIADTIILRLRTYTRVLGL